MGQAREPLEMSDELQAACRDLALAALQARQRGDPAAQAEAMAQLAAAHEYGLSIAILLWCDAYTGWAVGFDAQREIPPAQGCAFLGGRDPNEAERWAAEMIIARWGLDEAGWAHGFAQLTRLPAAETAGHILALLNLVAASLQALPRGWAVPAAQP